MPEKICDRCKQVPSNYCYVYFNQVAFCFRCADLESKEKRALIEKIKDAPPLDPLFAYQPNLLDLARIDDLWDHPLSWYKDQ